MTFKAINELSHLALTYIHKYTRMYVRTDSALNNNQLVDKSLYESLISHTLG